MQEKILLLLLAPAAGLTVDVVLQAVLARALSIGPRRLQVLSFTAGGAITLAVLGVLLADPGFAPADRIGFLVLHLLVYASFGFCFFNVISASVSSLRVRILKEMLSRHPAPIDARALAASYSARDILHTRLVRLQQGGLIDARNGRFFLQSRGIFLIGGPFAALRRFLLRS